MTAPTMSELVELGTAHNEDKAALQLVVMTMQEEIEEVKKRYLPAIQDLVEACAKSHGPLMAMLEHSERLFVRPKSVVIGQLQVGFESKERKLKIENEEAIILSIKASVEPDLVPTLVATEERLKLSALKAFDDATLLGLGISVKPVENKPFIRSISSSVAKMVDALVAEAIDKGGD